jgi:hypothetical protein
MGEATLRGESAGISILATLLLGAGEVRVTRSGEGPLLSVGGPVGRRMGAGTATAAGMAKGDEPISGVLLPAAYPTRGERTRRRRGE